ncbi:MAG TPA: MarC family protein [Gammaproteobacteria bacterium]|nr:MarC family protein [Gammaproteobacteria bacterium]
MISNAVLLFFVIDPFGLIPIYIALLARVPPHRRTPILVRELVIALFALVLFLFAGRYVLSALGISEPALLIAGALILFLIALPMIFPGVKLGLDSSDGQSEPLIVPLATPLFAGPSALTLVMLIGGGAGDWATRLGTVLIAWAGAAIVLALGNWIASWIGPRGLVAVERLMGMFLVAMSVEMLLSGLSRYYATLPH